VDHERFVELARQAHETPEAALLRVARGMIVMVVEPYLAHCNDAFVGQQLDELAFELRRPARRIVRMDADRGDDVGAPLRKLHRAPRGIEAADPNAYERGHAGALRALEHRIRPFAERVVDHVAMRVYEHGREISLARRR
jgi:hypothetical protein